jgi:hypothetical protein
MTDICWDSDPGVRGGLMLLRSVMTNKFESEGLQNSVFRVDVLNERGTSTISGGNVGILIAFRAPLIDQSRWKPG